MKNTPFVALLVTVLCCATVRAQNQTVTGNLTVTGTIGSAGAIDSDSNTFSFGTQGASFGAALLYQDANADTFTFSANRSPASWLWQHLTGVAAMRLDANHQLILYQADGTTAGITLTPATNQLSLGSATLTASGTAISTNGAFTAAGGITNTNGSLTGGTSGLTLNAGGTDQNITLTPSGTGKTIVNGSLLLGTTTDSGNGRLQLATHTTSAGGIGFGVESANTIFRTGAANLKTNAQWQVADTTASTSATTGSATFAGGVGVTGALWAGGTITSKSNGGAMYTGWQWGTGFTSTNPIFDGVTDNTTSGTNFLLGSKRTGDTNRRFTISIDGVQSWGVGGAPDTALYRSAAGTLKTDGAFAIAGALALGSANPSTIASNGTGNISLSAAAGTNQGIALYPSGTGTVSINQPANNLAVVNILGLPTYSTPSIIWYNGRPLFSAWSEGVSGTGDVQLGMANGTNARSSVVFRRAQGTLASPAVVLNGDMLGGVLFSGYDGSGAASGFINSAGIVGVVDNTYRAIGVSSVPQRIEFQIAPDGTATRIAAMTLKANGGLQLAPTSKTIPSWGTVGPALQVTGAIITDSTSTPGTIANAVMSSYGAPTFAFASAQTLTDGATVYIAGDPILGTNGTLGTGALVGLRNGGKSRLDGNVGVKANPKPNVSLYVTGQPGYSSGVSTGIGNTVAGWDSSQLTVNGTIYDAYFAMAAGTSTVPNIYAFNANGGVNGAGVTITNYTAYNASSIPTGGTLTNTKAFRGGFGAGAGRWNLYMDGTAANLLAGQTSITDATASTSTTTGALIVTGGVGITGNLNVGGTFSATNYAATSGAIAGGSTGLSLSAGGTNQNVTISPTGTGATILNGNVGIGTTTPAYKLEVVDTAAANGTISRMTRNGKTLEFYSGSMVDLQIGTPGNHSLGFYTNNNSPLLTLTADQKIGIGTTTPTEQLDVRGNLAVGPMVRPTVILKSNGVAANGRIFHADANASGRLDLSSNLNYDGTNWIRDDIAQNSRMLSFTGGVFQVRRAMAGANPATLITDLYIDTSGNVGIGTSTPSHKLAVKGTIRANEIIVDTGWADYVFDESYRLAPLSEVESHIKAEKHLPGIPSAAEVAEHGVSMGDMQAKLLSKVEELTLHLIAQEKQMMMQSERLDRLETENRQLRSKLGQP